MWKIFTLLALTITTVRAQAQDAPMKAVDSDPIQSVLAHRIFDEYFGCFEHRQGEVPYLGDALGADCMIQKVDTVNGKTFPRPYAGNGERNEDWYSWGKDVGSPCDCEVTKVVLNDTVNQPGAIGKPPATAVQLKRADGVTFVVAHLSGLVVKAGDRVREGAKLGVVGDNGFSRSPHIHIGAFKEGHALQIRFDLSNGESPR